MNYELKKEPSFQELPIFSHSTLDFRHYQTSIAPVRSLTFLKP